MLRSVALEHRGRKVIVLDSMSQVEDIDRGQVVIAASNGGKESGRLAVIARCACVVFNDAGVGKDEAGVAGLSIAEEAGIPAATIAHTSAAISDGMDTWHHGVISRVNARAAMAGLTVGATVRAAVTAFLRQTEDT